MPIYEYQCQQCQHQFDEIQKVDAAPLTDCPECAQSSLVKLMSAPSFRLKGSGWYETDFKKDKRRNLAGDDKPAADKKDTGSSSGKGETKAAGKADKPAAKSDSSGKNAAASQG